MSTLVQSSTITRIFPINSHKYNSGPHIKMLIFNDAIRNDVQHRIYIQSARHESSHTSQTADLSMVVWWYSDQLW